MKREYDFSKGERGKFYHSEADFYVPIYLERELLEELEKIALKRELEINAIVKELLRRELEALKSLEE